MTRTKTETTRWWLEQHSPRTLEGLKDSERDKLDELIGHEGFGLLLSLLGGERQGCYVQLSLLNLADDGMRRQATVLQGKIAGIERVRETLLELSAHDDPTNEGAKS